MTNPQEVIDNFKKDYYKGDGETGEMEDYEVHVKYVYGEDESWESAGEISLNKISSVQDMPQEIEIDGVSYFPQF